MLDAALPAFAERLRSENHTLKHALTDPRLLSGIGNAYEEWPRSIDDLER